MFKFTNRTSHNLSSFAARCSAAHNLYFIQTHPFSSSLKEVQNSPNQHSFTVNYLINSCGFLPEKALAASKRVKFEDPQKPDSVISFFKNQGFTQTQISNVIMKFPNVLLCDTQNTLLPKLEFLKSKGFSSTDVARIFHSSPSVLKRSLENGIIPSFEFISDLLESEEKTMASIKRYGGILLVDRSTLAQNTEILREAGVPDANIKTLLGRQPGTFAVSSDWLRHLVEEVKKMGFSTSKGSFVLAVQVLKAMSKSTLEKKVEVYKKWGSTKDEIFVAFKKNPWLMVASEDKINKVMDFCVKEMGWGSSFVVTRPRIITMSLEKRIVPRNAVYQALLSKGLIKATDIGLITFLQLPEPIFLEKVLSYKKEEGPELLKLYKEKLNLARDFIF